MSVTCTKIALEEHFIDPGQDDYFREIAPHMYTHPGVQQIMEQLRDTDALRIADMDKLGIQTAILSYFNGSGVQSDTDVTRAIRKSQEMNDFLATRISAYPNRFKGWAALAVQDPHAASTELRRCVNDLGFVGPMINGQTHGKYLDEPEFAPIWDAVAELDVPIYLHPGDSPPEQLVAYRDYPQLMRAAWNWSVETAFHTLRIICSGIFDRYPSTTLVLGHMGELLPYHLNRFDQTAVMGPQNSKHPISYYIKNNVMITTSGNVSPATLVAAQMAIGADRILFATDYPLGLAAEFTASLETGPLSDRDKEKIYHLNARRLFKLTT